jgi:hypothetical protein
MKEGKEALESQRERPKSIEKKPRDLRNRRGRRRKVYPLTGKKRERKRDSLAELNNRKY